jgi:hypothetical protein
MRHLPLIWAAPRYPFQVQLTQVLNQNRVAQKFYQIATCQAMRRQYRAHHPKLRIFQARVLYHQLHALRKALAISHLSQQLLPALVAPLPHLLLCQA